MKLLKRLIIFLFFVVVGCLLTFQKLPYNNIKNNFISSQIQVKDHRELGIALSNVNNKNNVVQRIYTQKDSKIMVNDKPFFPFGFYHDSKYTSDWTTTGAKRLNHLRAIADAGFNTIHPQIGGNYESDLEFLEEAEKLNVDVIPNFSYDSRSEIVKKYKGQPAIIGWDIADDVDNPENKLNPEKIRQWHNEVKAIDPNCITYISGGFTDKIKPYLFSADVIGFQSYPIDNDPNDKKPLRKNYYTIKSVTQDEVGNPVNQPIIANLQVFPWRNQYPTGSEIRNMTYSALINGVDGILYYSYFSDHWDLSKQNDLWNEIKLLAKEINQFQSVLLEGNLTNISTGVDDLYAGQWKYGDSVYDIVLSTSPDKSIEVSINLPGQVTGVAQPLFPGRPSGLILQNNKLNGSIKPGDVHVYKILQ